MPGTDDDKPVIRKAGPPPRSGREPVAKAKGPIDPPDAEEVVASTEPDDDLADYIVPPDPEPLPGLEENASADLISADLVFSTGGGTIPPATTSAGPVTTADTELVRKLEEELARARARVAGQDVDVSSWSAGPPPVAPQPGEVVLIHVREDGFTANGRVWYRGQELEFTVGASNWEATCDIHGNSWVTLGESDQIRRWGQVMFGHGPWPGQPFDNDRAALAERNRGRAAPSIPKLSSQKQLRI